MNKDDSMNKLNEVLQRQRERLEGMGESKDENLEAAFQDLERDINHIKQNLDNTGQEKSPGKYSLSVEELQEEHEL